MFLCNYVTPMSHKFKKNPTARIKKTKYGFANGGFLGVVSLNTCWVLISEDCIAIPKSGVVNKRTINSYIFVVRQSTRIRSALPPDHGPSRDINKTNIKERKAKKKKKQKTPARYEPLSSDGATQ